MICSYWREISWSTPSLWSFLVVCASSKHMATDIAWMSCSLSHLQSIDILSLATSQSQHWPISLINILPLGPILTSLTLYIPDYYIIFMQPIITSLWLFTHYNGNHNSHWLSHFVSFIPRAPNPSLTLISWVCLLSTRVTSYYWWVICTHAQLCDPDSLDHHTVCLPFFWTRSSYDFIREYC